MKPWLDPGGLVNVFALTNRALPNSRDLFEFLVDHFEELTFARLSVCPKGEGAVTVVFRYSLIGGTLDAPELRSSVDAVAVTAERLEDVMRKHFGGSAVGQPVAATAPGAGSADRADEDLPRRLLHLGSDGEQARQRSQVRRADHIGSKHSPGGESLGGRTVSLRGGLWQGQ